MEEQKKSIVKKAQETDRPEKMSYEQLENVAHQLSEQSKQLYLKLQEANMTNVFKRLDYLFKVVENEGVFRHLSFVERCLDEIESLMTIPEQEETSDTESKED